MTDLPTTDDSEEEPAMPDTDTFDPTATIRRGDLQTLATMLEDRHAHKVDAVVAARTLTVADDATLTVPGLDVDITDDGVTTIDGHVTVSDLAVGGFASRYDVPAGYLRRCKTSKPPLFAENVNAWMHDDAKNVLLRTFTGVGDDGTGGYLRQVLSDVYAAIDDLDVLMATLEGARSADTEIVVDSVDLSEKSMRVRFVAPQINVLAPDLLRGYRSPFTNGWGGDEARMRAHGFYAPGDEPIIFAGIEVSNSETGGAAFQIAPRLVVKVCSNGLVISRDAFRKIHLGSRLDEGVVRYSEKTKALNVDLVRSQTADAIRTFLDVDYMRATLARIEETASTPVARPETTITTVAKRLRYSDAERQTLLSHFVSGGQSTCGGILQAATSMAQTIDDPDRAAEIEASAIDAMEAAALVAV